MILSVKYDFKRLRHSNDHDYTLWRVDGNNLMIYDCLCFGVSEIITDFWKGATAGSTTKHVGCAASADANKIIGISTDSKDWFFHYYFRDGTKVETLVQNANNRVNVTSRIVLPSELSQLHRVFQRR